VGLHDADRPAGLHEHGLVLLQAAQGAHHGVEGVPVAGGLAAAPVDDELVGVLGDLGVEVVLQHPQRRFLLPSLSAQLRAARRADRPRSRHRASLLVVAIGRREGPRPRRGVPAALVRRSVWRKLFTS
jgi:hypothetical protein